MSENKKRKAFSIAFKLEVLDYMERNSKSSYEAAKHFGEADGQIYDPSMFRQWGRNKEEIRAQKKNKKRSGGGGRKPALGDLEEVLTNEIIEMKNSESSVVTRSVIAERALQLAAEHNIELKATPRWVSQFMKRNGLYMGIGNDDGLDVVESNVGDLNELLTTYVQPS